MPDIEIPPYAPIIPHLTMNDASAAIEFYVSAFGAQELSRQVLPDGQIMHAALSLNGGVFYLNDDLMGMGGTPTALGGSPVTIHLTVENGIDALWDRAVAAGATVEMPLEDQFWGSRYGMLRDPFGHGWSLGTPQKPVSEESVREAMAASV